MAAATVDTVSSKIKNGWQMALSALQRMFYDQVPVGCRIPVTDGTATVATTNIDDAGDILRISPKLPPGTHIWDFRGTPSLLDSHGTPFLVYDVVFVTEADVVTVTLVSGSTAASGTIAADRIRNAAVGKYCGEGYLALKVTTAARTAAAGTYKVAYDFSIGTVRPGQTKAQMSDAEA